MTGAPVDGHTSDVPDDGRDTMAPWPTATTRLVALLGWPARYSRSPAIHNAAFRHEGIDLAYVAMPCQDDALTSVVACLRAIGAVGANVTVPHKQTVMDLVDDLTDEARAVGAVNTLALVDDRVIGDNTDAAGLDDDWRRVLPPATLGEPVCVLGTGGGARAVILAAGRSGAEVVVVGRRKAAVVDIVSELGDHVPAGLRGAQVDHPEASAAVSASGLVVNATPMGMQGERLPDAFMSLRSGQVAYDLIYEPRLTPFLAAARREGAHAFDGLGMLIGQAARAFTVWTGRRAPVEVMERAAGWPAGRSGA